MQIAVGLVYGPYQEALNGIYYLDLDWPLCHGTGAHLRWQVPLCWIKK